MTTTPDDQIKEPSISRSYSFPLSLHIELRRVANARAEGNKSAMAEHFINVGMVADAEKTLPVALVQELSALASRRGVPFLKFVENTLASGLPLQREEVAGVSTTR